MKILNTIMHELIGLFIDDGSLALGVLIVVALAGISELLMADTRLMGGVILLSGCLGVLFVNVIRTGQR